MSLKVLSIWSSWLVGFSLLAPPLWAEETVEHDHTDVTNDPSVEAARERFARAVSFADQGRHQEALEVFRALQAERPHSILLYNIALCLSELGQYAEAVEALDRYLAGDDDDESRQRAALAERDRLQAIVESSPPQRPPETSTHEERDPLEPPALVEPLQSPTPQRPLSRRRLRPALFWSMFGLTAATAVSLAITGGITLHLSDQWLSDGDIDIRDRGRVLRNVSDGLLLLTVCEAIATLVIGLFTDFGSRTASGDVAMLSW